MVNYLKPDVYKRQPKYTSYRRAIEGNIQESHERISGSVTVRKRYSLPVDARAPGVELSEGGTIESSYRSLLKRFE